MDKEEKGKIIVEFNKDISELDSEVSIQLVKHKIEDLFEVENDLLCKIEFDKSDDISTITFQGNDEKTTIYNIYDKCLDFSFKEIIFENIAFDFIKNKTIQLFNLFSKSNELNISFKNCVFNSNDIQKIHDIKFEKLYFDGCEFDSKLSFTSCKFGIEFFIIRTRINDKVKNSPNKEDIAFYTCKFDYLPLIHIEESQNYELLFKKPSFNNKINLSNNVFDNKYKQVKFEDVDFKDIEFDFENNESICEQNILFIRSKFENIVFYRIENKTSINFDTCIFNKEFEYDDELFHQDKISFNNSTFNDSFVVRSNSKEINREISFENVTFNKDFKLNNIAINKILNFNKAKFKNTLEIKNSNLFDNINLDNAIFYQGIDFSGSAFQKFVNFYESQIYKYCNFNTTYFKYVPIFKTDITKQDIKMDIKFMTISDLSIYDLDKAIGAYISFVSLFKKDFKNEESKIVKIFRENFNMFKGVLLSKYNSFEASNYKKQELYLKELELKYINKESLKKSKLPKIKDKLDILMLGINRATSDHHDDLYQIIMFTFAIIGGYFMLNCICAYSNEIVDIVQKNVKYGKIIFFFFILFVNFLLATMFILYWFFQIYFNMITALRISIQLMKYIIILEFIIQEAIIAILILFVYLLAKINFKKFQLLFKLILFCVIVYLWYNHGYFSYIADLASDIQYVKFEYFLVITSFSAVFVVYVCICINIYRKRFILFFLGLLGIFGIFYSPSIITPFLGAFSEDARNHYLYKAIDELDSQKALELSRQILAKEPTSELNAKKTLKDYKDELKSSDLLDKAPELKRAVAIDGGVSRLNIAYYLVLAFCIFALQKTMRKNSIIPS